MKTTDKYKLPSDSITYYDIVSTFANFMSAIEMVHLQLYLYHN
jgi:hypothetical protein